MLKLWGRSNSINVQKVLWTLGELGLDFERIDAGGTFGVNDTEDFARLNPNRLVPVLEDDGFVLWESNVVVRYLAARCGDDSFCPSDIKARSDVERWMDWQVSTLWPPLRPLFIGLVRTPPSDRDPEALRPAQADVAKAFATLNDHLATRDFVGGNRFTMGDIPVGVTAYRWFALDIERPSLPHVERWYERLVARPTFAEHVMTPLT